MVLYPTPQVDELMTGLSIRDILRCHTGEKRRLTASQTTPWTNECLADLPIRAVEGIVLRQRGVSDLATGVHSCVFSRRESAIAPARSKSPRVSATRLIQVPKLLESLSRYESALVGSQRFSRELCLSIASDPQRASECCDDDRGKSGDAATVGVGELSGAESVARQRDLENGWIIVGGSAAFVVLILLYAGLEEWRTRALKKKQRHQKN